MEVDALERSDIHGGVRVKEEKSTDSGSTAGVDEESSKEEVAVKVGSKRPYDHENDDTKPSSPDQHKDLSRKKQQPVIRTDTERLPVEPGSMASISNRKEKTLQVLQDDQLESARAEVGEVREENQRLKMYLNRIMKDYQDLQMQFYDTVRQESNKKPTTHAAASEGCQDVEEPELVSLTLGRFSTSDPKNIKDEKNISTSGHGKEDTDREKDQGLTLGLDCNFEVSKSDVDNEPSANPSPENSSGEPKEGAAQTWPPSKVLKTTRTGDDEILQQNSVKKARVSVRARCDTPTMNDGCQWRKYGQKIAKGNPCPRAYYRCTVAPSCPVRKQVQRCAEDMSILITTYEGTHNHPLPMSATAMASTTSAAASMLLSGSSSSSSQPGGNGGATAAASLHGLNYYLSDSSKPKQFYLPNSSFSTSPSHPTITLDLTSTPSSSSSPFTRFSCTPRYPSTSLNFSSSEPKNTMSWGPANGKFLGYGSTQPYMKSQIGSLNIGRQSIENSIYQSLTQKNNLSATLPHHHQQSLVPDTIAAATKVITADPSFQSALAAALSSIIGSTAGGAATTGGATQALAGGLGDNNLGQTLKWAGDHQPFAVTSSTYSSPTGNGNGCGSSYLINKSSSSSTLQPGSLMFLQPSKLPFSAPKSASSPGDSRNHSN